MLVNRQLVVISMVGNSTRILGWIVSVTEASFLQMQLRHCLRLIKKLMKAVTFCGG
ncbi:unnamed protein product [Brassica oleracea var. botrytis]